jgi:hypothetical protein
MTDTVQPWSFWHGSGLVIAWPKVRDYGPLHDAQRQGPSYMECRPRRQNVSWNLGSELSWAVQFQYELMQLNLSPVKWDGVLTVFCGCTHYVKTKWTVNVSGAVQGNSEEGHFTSLVLCESKRDSLRYRRHQRWFCCCTCTWRYRKTAHIKLTK